MSAVPQVPRRPTGPAHDGRALARCVADPDAFAAAWGRRPLLATASELPRSFDDLLDLDGVDELLSRRGLRTPFLRMAKDGVVVDSGRYTRPGGVGAAIGDQVDDTAVTRLFADGTTIVLQALHRLWPPIIDFAGALAGELGHPVQVNAYVTPPSSRGFAAHYDIHDVFVLQLAGEKRWIVHEPVHEWPLRSQPWTQRRRQVERAVAETEPTIDTVLRPGDALYLPRGFLHSAEALGDVSAHLTVGIHVVTRQALVEALLAAAEDEAGLRQALPVGIDLTSADALAEDLEATIDLLVATPPVRRPGAGRGPARREPRDGDEAVADRAARAGGGSRETDPEHACPSQAGASGSARGHGRPDRPPPPRRDARGGRRPGRRAHRPARRRAVARRRAPGPARAGRGPRAAAPRPRRGRTVGSLSRPQPPSRP